MSRRTGVWVPITDPEKMAPQAVTHELRIAATAAGINEQTEPALDAAPSLQSFNQA